MTISYDPDGSPDFPVQMEQVAREQGMRLVRVVCNESGAQPGDSTGVSFWAMVEFPPRAGDVIVLEDGKQCEVRRTFFKVASSSGLRMLVPTISVRCRTGDD